MDDTLKERVRSFIHLSAVMSNSVSTTNPKPHVEARVDGQSVVITPELEAAVLRAHKGLLSSLPKELTTTQAADFLDVSRPFVIKLIKKGELPCRLVGKHRRIPSEAVMEYREKTYLQAKQAADEMTRIAEEMGLYEAGEPS
jgi:excisionase family DNA binding protein